MSGDTFSCRTGRLRCPWTGGGAPCAGMQPRHRFMGAYEQRVEPPNKDFQCVVPPNSRRSAGCGAWRLALGCPADACTCLWCLWCLWCARTIVRRYLLFAAEPYETIGFKIPNLEIDKSEGKFFTDWNREKLVFTVRAMVQGVGSVLLCAACDGWLPVSLCSCGCISWMSGRLLPPLRLLVAVHASRTWAPPYDAQCETAWDHAVCPLRG